MEDNEYTSIKDILEWCEREGVRKVGELTQEESQAEKDEQIARYYQEKINEILQSGAYKLMQLFEENEQANKHNIAAQAVLLKALKDAGNHPVMESSPEVKRIAELFHRLISYRRASFSFTPEAIFEQILEPHERHVKVATITANQSRAGSAPKKPKEKERALTCWNEWASADSPRKMHRNKTTFVKHLDNLNLCSPKMGALWVEEFREQHPSPALEKILPLKKE